MKKKVLILYTSIGLGHKSIAENIAYYLTEDDYEVRLADAHKVQDGKLARWGKIAYQFLLRQMPFVWDWLHSTEWFITMALPYRSKVASYNYQNILLAIQEFQPDVVIATHNTASAVISFLKEKKMYSGLFGIAFSDYYLHRFWLFNNADFYLANTREQKQIMEKLAIPAEIIFVCGMMLKPQVQVDVSTVRTKLNIPAKNKVVLFSSGSQGIGLNESMLADLQALEKTTVLVVCGNDAEMFSRLSAVFTGTNIVPLKYYTPMEELYAIADIFVTKPGGLSIAEALRFAVPILVFYLLPGGEVFNYEYLQGKGLIMPEPVSLYGAIKEELDLQDFRKDLEKNTAKNELFPKPEVLLLALATVLQNSTPQ